jgi:hypothetical protein
MFGQVLVRKKQQQGQKPKLARFLSTRKDAQVGLETEHVCKNQVN